MFKLNNNPIDINAQHEINGNVYPRGTLLLRRDEWPTLGIVEEADPLPPAPTQAELNLRHNETILAQISQIEQNNLMARPMREYMLTVTTGIQYDRIKAVDDSIVALRNQLI